MEKEEAGKMQARSTKPWRLISLVDLFSVRRTGNLVSGSTTKRLRESTRTNSKNRLELEMRLEDHTWTWWSKVS